jgi:hypothetical protein
VGARRNTSFIQYKSQKLCAKCRAERESNGTFVTVPIYDSTPLADGVNELNGGAYNKQSNQLVSWQCACVYSVKQEPLGMVTLASNGTRPPAIDQPRVIEPPQANGYHNGTLGRHLPPVFEQNNVGAPVMPTSITPAKQESAFAFRSLVHNRKFCFSVFFVIALAVVIGVGIGLTIYFD